MKIPYIDEWVSWRLRDIAENAESGNWELVGKTYGWGSGGYSGQDEIKRFKGGWSKEVPELSDGPSVAAKAIRKGKGVIYRRIVSQVRQYALAHGLARRERKKRPSVAPHESLTKKCSLCGLPHTRKQHKFHGYGAFHKTHLWGFRMNPAGSMPMLYGRVLRVEAQKTQPHVCDAECRKADHCYYHDFGRGVMQFGLPEGTVLEFPNGEVYKLGERSLVLTRKIRRSR